MRERTTQPRTKKKASSNMWLEAGQAGEVSSCPAATGEGKLPGAMRITLSVETFGLEFKPSGQIFWAAYLPFGPSREVCGPFSCANEVEDGV